MSQSAIIFQKLISLLDSAVFKIPKYWRAELNLSHCTSEGVDVAIAAICTNAFDALDWIILAGQDVCDCICMMGCVYKCRRNIFQICKDKGHLNDIIYRTITIRSNHILGNLLRWIFIQSCLESLEYVEKVMENRWNSVNKSP